MVLIQKLRSAARLYRRAGLSDVAHLLSLKVAGLARTYRPIPSDPVRCAKMVTETLNGWSGLSRLVVLDRDVGSVRDALLSPYLRHRRAEVVKSAQALGVLSPLEIVIVADCLLAVSGFKRLCEGMTVWVSAVRGTPFARRIAQVECRTALRLGRLHDAVAALEAAPSDLGSLLLRGDVLDAAGRMDEARVAYEAAIRRDDTDSYAREVYGFHLMKAGRVRDGLESWAAAERLGGRYPLRRHRPQWTGEALGRRRLMVLFEHGLGDMIQVSRFLPRLLAREPDATVFARLPAPLLGLMARQFPRVRFVHEDEREPDYELFVPSMHLAGVLDAPDLEPRAQYLDLGTPAPRRSERLQVGVCWRGHPRQYEATRSIPLDTFATLFEARAVDFTVLLNRLTTEETIRIAAEPNVATPPIGDFVDLASLVASCDLVVSVDTAVAHLAGAGGTATVLLSRPDSCWRWGPVGSEGPWYESVKVLRHDGDMDWPRLLDLAAECIRSCRRASAAA